jgi:tetratricopeptide (TPR) repeat protein
VRCSVIAASRQVRREREALEESKRQLEAQREREAATRRSLVRARAIAAVSAVLMLIAAGSAVFGWINLRRAREAEVQTQAARQLAEQARSESENLVGFLLDQFYEELQPTGRVEIVENLADKAVSYYDSLPPELVTRKTKVNHGMALIRKASAIGDGGDAEAAVKLADEAGVIFEQLRAAGDLSEETALGLALARFTRSNSSYAHENIKDFKEAVDLLKPFVASGSASRASKLALADTYNFLCHMVPPEEGNQDCIDGRKILADMGALDLSDLTAASIYGDVADSQARILLDLNKPEEAAKLEHTVYEIGEKVLTKRPGDLRAMKDVYFARELLGEIAEDEEDLVEAEAQYRASVEAARTYSQFNPADNRGLNLYSQCVVNLAWVLYEEGRISDSVDTFRALVAMESAIPDKAELDNGYYVAMRSLALIEAQRGHGPEAEDWRAKDEKDGIAFDKAMGADATFDALSVIDDILLRGSLAAAQGDYPRVYELVNGAKTQFGTLKQQSALIQFFYGAMGRATYTQYIDAALRTGRFGEAEAAARKMMGHPFNMRALKRRSVNLDARYSVQLGHALVGLGRKSDARPILEAAITVYRASRARGADGTTFRLDFAGGLYQLSRAQEDDEAGRAKRSALLGEAAGVLFGLSTEAQDLVSSKELAKWVGAARAQAGN